MGTTRTNRTVGGAVAGLVLLGLIVAVVNRGDGDDEALPVPDSAPATASEPESSTTSSADVVLADVPAIDCAPLLTLDEKDEALGMADLPFEERDLISFARSEVCTDQRASDERVFVRVEPGSPDDFAPDARVFGVAGETVDGVGDAARWFGGVEAEGGGAGLLSVRRDTPLGVLHFRIVVGRPDLSADERLDVAIELALAALPRFPGVEVEPEEVTFEHEPPDQSGAGFVDNLLAKEESGAWALEDGLVATLRLLAGEVEATEVIEEPELVDYSGTGVIQMAREYLKEGQDSQAQAEIERLLGYLSLSRERLEQMTGDAATTVQAVPVILAGTSTDIAQGSNDCQTYWGVNDPCMVEAISPELDELYGAGKYKIFAPTPGTRNTRGWTDQYVLWVTRAMEDAAKTYERLGRMPRRVEIMLTPFEDSHTQVDHLPFRECLILVNTPMQELGEAHFKQVVAEQMADCMIAATFPAQLRPGYQVTRWWREGLRVWLGTVVYPGANEEWVGLPEWLAEIEIATTLLERNFTNWLFFEHKQPFTGDNLGLVRSLPSRGGRAQQEAALAAYPGMAPIVHTYAQGLTDQDIPDSGGGRVPYRVEGFNTVQIRGPMLIIDDPRRFGVVRLHLVVDPGQRACLEYRTAGRIESSWREGAPGGAGGSWSNDLPVELQGEAVIVVTTTQSGGKFAIAVTEVDDEPRCDEAEESGSSDSGSGSGGSSVLGDCRLELECGPSRYYINEVAVAPVPGADA